MKKKKINNFKIKINVKKKSIKKLLKKKNEKKN